MATEKTSTISVRVSKRVAEWFAANGGSERVRNVLYGYLLTQTCGVSGNARAELLKTVIDESLINELTNQIDDESLEQRNIAFE